MCVIRRVALQAAAQHRQVMEKLKHRWQDERKSHLARVEAGLIDEMAMTIHRRRSAAS